MWISPANWIDWVDGCDMVDEFGPTVIPKASSATPKVSVCCAWYNRADYIRETVDSLLAQDLNSFEIVLVNDGSPDPRVREILDSYDDPRLRVIHQENTGFTKAIIRAISESNGEYIAIQGAGDYSYPQRLSRQANELDYNRDVSIVGSYYIQENLVNGIVKNFSVRPSIKGEIGGFEFSHGELMYRRSSYEEVGGYRPFFAVGQGADLWMRMLRNSNSHVVPEVLYKQYLFSDGVSHSKKKLAFRRRLGQIRVINEHKFRKSGNDTFYSENADYLLKEKEGLVNKFFRAILNRYIIYIYRNKKKAN